jgi:hypothetical protein
MASALYDKGRDKFLNGDLDWVGATTVKIALCSATYVANMSTDEFFSSVSSAVIGTPMTLSNRSSAGGVANADDVTSAAVATGSTISQVVIYESTGTDSTSPLIARIDFASPVPTNGGTVTLAFDNGANKIFKL